MQYPELTQGAIRLLPVPIEYHRWWKRTEACFGAKKKMRILFYVVPRATLGPHPDSAHLTIVGLYVRDSIQRTGQIIERVYLARTWMHTEWLVRHEMLHSFVGRGHPDEAFRQKCRLTYDLNRGPPTPPPIPIIYLPAS